MKRVVDIFDETIAIDKICYTKYLTIVGYGILKLNRSKMPVCFKLSEDGVPETYHLKENLPDFLYCCLCDGKIIYECETFKEAVKVL